MAGLDTGGASDDRTGTLWRDDGWISFFPLNELSVLDYFALSPFYDSNCNNEELRRRGEGPERLAALPPGVEYKLQDSFPPHLFVIRKVNRKSPQSEEVLAFYYVLDGTIYQAPTLYAAIAAKLGRCLHHIKSGYALMQERYDPLQKALKGHSSEKTEAAAMAASMQQADPQLVPGHVERVGKILDAVMNAEDKTQAPPHASSPQQQFGALRAM